MIIQPTYTKIDDPTSKVKTHVVSCDLRPHVSLWKITNPSSRPPGTLNATLLYIRTRWSAILCQTQSLLTKYPKSLPWRQAFN